MMDGFAARQREGQLFLPPGSRSPCLLLPAPRSQPLPFFLPPPSSLGVPGRVCQAWKLRGSCRGGLMTSGVLWFAA